MNAEQKALVDKYLKPEAVAFAYNGKNGCRCGCNGTYKYHPLHKKAAGKNRGYAVGDDEVSERSIKMTVTKLLANLDDLEVDQSGNELFFDLQHGVNGDRVSTVCVLLPKE